MRILSLHNQYRIRAGEDGSRAAVCEELGKRGHVVDEVTWDSRDIGTAKRLSVGARAIWSRESYREVAARLSQRRYDIVHVENFFPLVSPSVHYAAYRFGVPVVQSLRNYRLLCPSAVLFRNGGVCEDCVGRFVPWSGIAHGCYHDSRANTTAVAAMLVAHRTIGTWKTKVAAFVALTRTSRDVFIRGGLPAEKLYVVPNFIPRDPGVGSDRREGYLFVGRLSTEKGILTLLRAWKAAARGSSLTIIGTGPLEKKVRGIAEKDRSIKFFGALKPEEVLNYMQRAKALVFPSEWYEGLPRTIIEAYACGTPVIACNLGSMAELVDGGQTGELYEPGSVQGLLEAWKRFEAADPLAFCTRARARFEAEFTARRGIASLEAVYCDVTSKVVGRRPKKL